MRVNDEIERQRIEASYLRRDKLSKEKNAPTKKYFGSLRWPILMLLTSGWLLRSRCPPTPSDDSAVASPIESKSTVHDIVSSKSRSDIVAMTFWDVSESQLQDQIREEREAYMRDEWYLPITYKARLDNKHFNDINHKDEYQKEVYLAAREVMRAMVPSHSSGEEGQERRGLVVDMGEQEVATSWFTTLPQNSIPLVLKLNQPLVI